MNRNSVLFIGLLTLVGSVVYNSQQSTTPVVTDTKPIVPIPQPEPVTPIGSGEPIEDEPQAEPEIEPASAPTYRAKQKVWVRTGWRRGHWEWR